MSEQYGDGCSACPLRYAEGVGAAYRVHVERAIINWLGTMTHTPSYGSGALGDIVRWQVIEGHRLPTVREDLVALAAARSITTGGGELVSFLADLMEPRTREMLAFSLAAAQ